MQFPYKNKIDKLLSKFVDFTGADEGYLPKLRKRRPLGRASQLSLLARTVDSRQYFIRTTQKRTQLWVRSRGADEGTRTHMVSHRNLKPARLPVSPHPLTSSFLLLHGENV